VKAQGFIVYLNQKLPKSTFCPRLFSSLGGASARKLRLGQKNALFGLDTQTSILIRLVNLMILL
jgi:hypothetical protein